MYKTIKFKVLFQHHVYLNIPTIAKSGWNATLRVSSNSNPIPVRTLAVNAVENKLLHAISVTFQRLYWKICPKTPE